jgi:hypothetical protein
MINYEFLERRFDQLNEDDCRQAEYMVDGLLLKNCQGFMNLNLPNDNIDDICRELWDELDLTYNPDIPF